MACGPPFYGAIELDGMSTLTLGASTGAVVCLARKLYKTLPYERCHDLERELVSAHAREQAACIRENDMQAEKSTTASQLQKAEARAERLAARVKKLEGAQAAAVEASLKELEGSQIAAAEAATRAERLAARVKELEDAQTTAAEVAARRRSAPWKGNKNGKRDNCTIQKYGHWLKTQPGEHGTFSARQLRVPFNKLEAAEHARFQTQADEGVTGDLRKRGWVCHKLEDVSSAGAGPSNYMK